MAEVFRCSVLTVN